MLKTFFFLLSHTPSPFPGPFHNCFANFIKKIGNCTVQLISKITVACSLHGPTADIRIFLIKGISLLVSCSSPRTAAQKKPLDRAGTQQCFSQHLLSIQIKCWNQQGQAEENIRYLYKPSISPVLLVFRPHKASAHATQMVFDIH